MVKINKITKYLIKISIQVYRLTLSPYIGSHCRFIPSCSSYCEQAIAQWGIFKGLKLTVGRLLRCHPFKPGGYDPIPPFDQS